MYQDAYFSLWIYICKSILIILGYRGKEVSGKHEDNSYSVCITATIVLLLLVT